MSIKYLEVDKDISILDSSLETYEQCAAKLAKLESIIEKADSQTAFLKSILAGE